jgi:methionyl-tRNA formyltransferase
MRIVFIGAVEFSRRTLKHLIHLQANVVGVCTLEPSSFNSDYSDLSDFCSAHGTPWAYAPDINSRDSLAWIDKRSPDVIFCFGWSRLLKQELLGTLLRRGGEGAELVPG